MEECGHAHSRALPRTRTLLPSFSHEYSRACTHPTPPHPTPLHLTPHSPSPRQCSLPSFPQSVSAITHLAHKSKRIQTALTKEGGIPLIAHVLVSVSASGNAKELMAAAHLCSLTAQAISQRKEASFPPPPHPSSFPPHSPPHPLYPGTAVTEGNKENQTRMAEAGAIPPLVSMLGSPNPQMQANAAAALAAMTGVTAGSPHHENQSAVARTGAIAPLCALVREGVEEVKEQSASALWALSDSNLANKATTSKLGGIEPLVALVVSAHNESALSNAQGALISLSAKHAENRGAIAKLLVKLVAKLQTAPAGAKNILLTVSLFADDGPANQVALATAGAIPQLILKLSDGSDSKEENDAAHCEAAHALLSMATGNATVQTLITRVGGVPPLIELVAKGNMDAQKHAARALWHLATDNQAASSISSSGGIPPLVAMLSLGDLQGKETAAATISRLSRVSPSVALSVANEGGVAPLIRLLTHGSQAAQQQAAAAIADVGSVPATRDVIAEAGGVAALVGLLKSIAHGTAETAARALANLARDGVMAVAAAAAKAAALLPSRRPYVRIAARVGRGDF